MKPIHALVIAGTLAFGVVLGVTAVTKTSTLGASARHTSAAVIIKRTHQLDSFEATLQKALKNRPPRLPRLPAARAAATSAPAAVPAPMTVASAATPRVVYQRAAPIIVHKHSRHGDDGAEAEGGRGGDRGGQGGGQND